MPLNKLDNFIKNTEGRILYVSPADLDSTDSIDNTGNSLARPFKTIQRALIESARFSYLRGNSNDEIEKTTILLMPGEHVVDNRPGFKIKEDGGQAKVVAPSSAESFASSTLNLDLNTNFDLTQEDNILYKFNSVEGGVIVPRGTSIVGLDLRKTKIRPLYVPNPTDTYDSTPSSAIFRITGTCYFWQFSLFDGNENGLVYTDPEDFSANNKSKPTFSHHKLTCFEYADGVNLVSGYDLTDLDMYYAKLSNAYGTGSGSPNRNIDSKYPAEPDGFAKQRPEWEIVGAFAADPLEITSIIAGNGSTPTNQITVTTSIDHNLTTGTPIKIRGVDVDDYNVSTKVQNIDPINPKVFTYVLPTFRANLPASPIITGDEKVNIETDTVSGASPYIFNISLRSVYGMNGMKADGAKASGFRSMVVAQFTGVSLQKDDRAFVKYDKTSRTYSGIPFGKTTGGALSFESSALNPSEIYHLDSQAVYRNGWEQTHIRVTNDAILQIVSVFAIGYNKHFSIESGGDASITNSNSNFGQLSLTSDGFKKEAFEKDNKAFITNIIAPRTNTTIEENVDWLTIDVGMTTSVGLSTHLYLRGFTSLDDIPPVLTQGYRIGAKINDKLFVKFGEVEAEASILMENGVDNSSREFNVSAVANNMLTIGNGHGLKTGEKVVLISDSADYPENIIPHVPYFIISQADSSITADRSKVKLASTKTDAENGNNIVLYFGSDLRIISRVTEKNAGDAGSPVQFDSEESRWFINVDSGNTIYSTLSSSGVAGLGVETDPTFIKRAPDIRSIDEKIYKFRVVVPKELSNAKNPESGFVIQESSTTNVEDQSEFTLTEFTTPKYNFDKNPRFIATCTHSGVTTTSSVRVEIPHNLEIGDKIIIRGVTDTVNTSGDFNKGYNGTFEITAIPNNLEFSYRNNQTPAPGTFSNDTSVRNTSLPRFERNDNKSNLYIYRNEVINEYIDGQQDGVYHIYALKANAQIDNEFTNLNYSQNVVDLYPQLNRDNVEDSPGSTKTKALRSPIGEVHTSDLKNSITRESADNFITKFTEDLTISNVGSLSGGTQTLTFTRNHNFDGIVKGSVSAQGASYTPGTYFNVKLLNSSQTGTWNGASATVIVNSSGNITSAQITSSGSGYTAGSLFFDQTIVGAGDGNARFTITSDEIRVAVGDFVQITGIGTTADSYNVIDSVPSINQISIAKTSGDPVVLQDQIAIHVGTAVTLSSSSFSSGITTFECSSAHGLVAGNKFRVLDENNNNLGDFLVKSRVGVTTFVASTTNQLTSPFKILKHYFSSNSGTSDASSENLAKRGQYFYDKDSLHINDASGIGINTTLIPVSHVSSGIGTTERFPIGSYIQIDNEIMRVSASDFTGTNKLKVIRGVLASESSSHDNGSLIRKIKPIPVEFRRPSIIRASGHTFEYLGYGPGNYSTGLPQVQDRTLTEREEFLSQAQERSAGIVVYTGMNNRGDFYIGNTKKSSATGEETSFDTPIPTVAGEDPARLSAIFDEITIKERIIVEGGDSGEILSQFDGPVTFNNDVRVKDNLSITGKLRITDNTESTSTSNGALVLGGGLGVAGNLNVGGNLGVGSMFIPDDKKLNFGNSNDLQISHRADFSSQLDSFGDLITPSSATVIEDAGTGPIVFKTNGGGGEGAFQFFDHNWNPKLNIGSGDDSGVKLYDGNTGEKLRTIGTGVSITGQLIADEIKVNDDEFINVGTGNDLQLKHTGTNSFIESKTGYLMIRNTRSASFEDATIYIRAKTDKESIICRYNAGVDLYYNDTKRFETTDDGAKVTGELQVTDDITAFFSSDERLKDNIVPIDDPLAKVISISGNTFDWNENTNNDGSDTGVIAQEIEALGLPGLVTTRDNGYKAVRYEKLVPLLVEAIKELSGKVDVLEQKLSDK